MADLFDPAVYVRLPGTDAAVARANLRPCPCGEATFEVVVGEHGRVSCQCPRCCRRKGRVTGYISMVNGATRSVPRNLDART